VEAGRVLTSQAVGDSARPPHELSPHWAYAFATLKVLSPSSEEREAPPGDTEEVAEQLPFGGGWRHHEIPGRVDSYGDAGLRDEAHRVGTISGRSMIQSARADADSRRERRQPDVAGNRGDSIRRARMA
jgi:hypothetical protein